MGNKHELEHDPEFSRSLEKHEKEQTDKIENRRKNSWRNDYSEGYCADILDECGIKPYR